MLVAYLVVIWPVGYWISKITVPWSLEIGVIGFLIAAKSISRFGETNNPAHRKEAEYILIGTMISFTVAIVPGLFVNWVLGG